MGGNPKGLEPDAVNEALEAMPCAVLELDAEMRIQSINGETERVLQLPRQEIIGKPLNVFARAATRIFLQSYVYPTLAQEGRVDEVHLKLVTGQGVEIPLLVFATFLGQSPQGRTRFYCFPWRQRNLSEVQLYQARADAEVAEAQVRSYQERLFQQERMAAMGGLAAGVAHELSSPLTYIEGNLHLLRRELGKLAENSEIALSLEDLELGLRQVKSLVKNLKTFSRVDSTHRAPVDLNQVARMAVRMSRGELNRLANLKLTLHDGPLEVLGDEGQLCQVLINLMMNSAQAFPAETPKSQRRIDLRTGIDHREAWLEVSDNGPGVPLELQTRIFEPFFTTKAVGQGTGLGLSLSQGIVVNLGGLLEYIPLPEGGSCFRASLPQLDPTPASP